MKPPKKIQTSILCHDCVIIFFFFQKNSVVPGKHANFAHPSTLPLFHYPSATLPLPFCLSEDPRIKKKTDDDDAADGGRSNREKNHGPGPSFAIIHTIQEIKIPGMQRL